MHITLIYAYFIKLGKYTVKYLSRSVKALGLEKESILFSEKSKL